MSKIYVVALVRNFQRAAASDVNIAEYSIYYYCVIIALAT
jgi:hypothetical protein